MDTTEGRSDADEPAARGSTAGSRFAAVGLVRATVVCLSARTLAGTATAHEVGGSQLDVPIPLSLLLVGAGATVALTALLVAFGARPESHTRELASIPPGVATAVRSAGRLGFLLAVAAAVVAGLVGRQVPAANAATVFTWPVWFHGLAAVAALVGSPWPTLAPWRTLYAGLVRLEGGSIAVLGSYPERLGAWPALVGFGLLIGIVENLTVVPRSPRLTAVIVAGYTLLMLAGAVAYGDAWFRNADPLGVLYRLVGRVAVLPIERTDDGGYVVGARFPWTGCLGGVGNRSLVVFVVATVYTVSFDGFTNTRAFQSLLFDARELLPIAPATSGLLYVAGLAGFVAAFLLAAGLVERLGKNGPRDWWGTARAFAPTLVPIAAAYEIAHNYPFVLRNLGRLPAVALEPVAPAVHPIDPLWWLPLPAFWGSQVLLIVLGHVAAVVAAHAVAVEQYGAGRPARRGHLPLVVVMVAYTMVSLWIVSQPVVT